MYSPLGEDLRRKESGGPSVMHHHSPSRRKTSRIQVPEDTWVYWHCKSCEDVSRIRDLSPAGLFLETPRQFPADTETRLHFLVPEGEISAQAVVRHARPGTGLGFRFMSVREQHRRQLVALISRLRGLSPFHNMQQVDLSLTWKDGDA
jgi:hypothetical protein